MRLWILILLPLGLISCNKSDARFEKRSSIETGIDFQNNLEYTEDFNPYTYRNFFNGGGVALGDINNDGLDDIFFSGNEVNDQLYLNQGNMVFKNISKSSGIVNQNNWSTGASMADVNNDGFIDIYVSTVSDYKNLKGHNRLYINNGDLTFTESSKKIGLDLTGNIKNPGMIFADMQGTIMDTMTKKGKKVKINQLCERPSFFSKKEIKSIIK